MAKGGGGSGAVVEVSSCTGKPNQQWKWETKAAPGGSEGESGSGQKVTGQISSKAHPDMCIDDGDFPAPPGTDGDCAALTQGDAVEGPGISLVNAGNHGLCNPSSKPQPTEAFTYTKGVLSIGNGQCVAALRGKPSPYGPMQLWAKPLVGGAVAVLLANRGSSQDPAVSVTVDLSELPGLKSSEAYRVRDLWKHQPADGVLRGGKLMLKAASQGSEFFVISPN